MKDNFKIDFIGIGAQKSATSWIYKMLIQHPEICGFYGKETHFFSDDDKYDKGIEYYKEFFFDCDSRKKIGEYSADYLTNKKVPLRIKKYFPDVKIIISLRNPVERAISRINHLKSNDRIKKNYKEYVSYIDDFPEIIENGLYSKYIKNYLELFPKENIHIIIYDDLLSSPQKEIKKLYKFLNIDDSFVPCGISVRINSSEERLSSVHKFINKVYLKLRKRYFGKKIINFFRKIGIRYYIIQKLLYNKKKLLQINDQERKLLYNYFKDDIRKTKKIINKDLSNWLKNI